VDDLAAATAKADITVLLQAHTGYDLETIARTANAVLDSRGAMPALPAVEYL